MRNVKGITNMLGGGRWWKKKKLPPKGSCALCTTPLLILGKSKIRYCGYCRAIYSQGATGLLVYIGKKP